MGTAYTANQVCTVDFTFTPAGVGQRQGAIMLYTTASPSAPVGTTFIEGTGTGTLIAYSSSSLTTPAGVESPSGNGLDAPYQFAFDGTGNLYVADNASGGGPNAIFKLAYSGGTYQAPVEVGGTPGNGTGVAIDGAGNLYMDGNGISQLKRSPTRTAR